MAAKKVTKYDVLLAGVQRQADRERLLIVVVGGIIAIGVATFPIKALADLIEPFAGEQTVVHVNVVAGISLGMSVVLNFGLFVKGHFRRKTIKRQRDRLNELEGAEA